MDRAQILSTLRQHASDLQRLGASHLFLFGSASRDEADPSSDIDLFFDFDDPGFSIVELATLQERLRPSELALATLCGAPTICFAWTLGSHNRFSTNSRVLLARSLYLF